MTSVTAGGDRGPGPAGYALPDEFWRQFVARSWERPPTVIGAPLARPLLTSSELFDALIVAAEQYRASRNVALRTRHIRFSVRHAAVITDVERLLPVPGDGSLEGYF